MQALNNHSLWSCRGRSMLCKGLGHLFIDYSSVLNYVGCWVAGPEAPAGVPHSELGASKRQALPISFVDIF